jgi:hypothetical protein
MGLSRYVLEGCELSHESNTGVGNMPHLMPSGQDFFTQLKKQLATLEQGKAP